VPCDNSGFICAERVYVAKPLAGAPWRDHEALSNCRGRHSRPRLGSATDVASAFAAMRGTSSPAARAQRTSHLKSGNGRVRTIVFHGASDQIVHPSNAEMILAEARAGLADSSRETRHDGSAGGRAYTRTVITDASGVPHVEHWAIEGLRHAWSGGSPEGSHTDQHGPDASREMLRFFLGGPAQPPTN
jgi:poly(3-hydroxybutyrate) depolymerase